jgi:2,4-dienoyl-CoA reductase-like NADH-dependent reductase (Old Yellow Enzyme family)
MLLFSPLTIGGVKLRNRIVVPPMHPVFSCKGIFDGLASDERRGRTALMIPERYCESIGRVQQEG